MMLRKRRTPQRITTRYVRGSVKHAKIFPNSLFMPSRFTTVVSLIFDALNTILIQTQLDIPRGYVHCVEDCEMRYVWWHRPPVTNSLLRLELSRKKCQLWFQWSAPAQLQYSWILLRKSKFRRPCFMVSASAYKHVSKFGVSRHTDRWGHMLFPILTPSPKYPPPPTGWELWYRAAKPPNFKICIEALAETMKSKRQRLDFRSNV